MNKIILLGAGRIGKAIVHDLHNEYAVSVADINTGALDLLARKYRVQTMKADLSDVVTIKNLVKDFDLVIGAVPGFMGFQMAKAVIEAGVNLVDISFFSEDPFTLDRLAKDKSVIAVTDVGVAPGLDNMILGYHNEQMEVTGFTCLVGGLPVHPEPPFFYKAPFSPIDVLEEYTRPSRLMIDGKIVVKEALTDLEPVDLPGVGILEAFNTDGLRSLVDTMSHIPNMKEKTLRYPKHVEYMKVLRTMGLFDKETITIKGSQVRPIDVTARLLFPHWALAEGEPELTVMQVIVEGIEDQQPVKYTYDLLDKYDQETGLTSMARTTGFTCTAAARMVLEGMYSDTGISPAEYVCRKEENFRFLLRNHEERGIRLLVTKTTD